MAVRPWENRYLDINQRDGVAILDTESGDVKNGAAICKKHLPHRPPRRRRNMFLKIWSKKSIQDLVLVQDLIVIPKRDSHFWINKEGNDSLYPLLDKAIKRFLVRNIVEQAAVRDVQEACARPATKGSRSTCSA